MSCHPKAHGNAPGPAGPSGQEGPRRRNRHVRTWPALLSLVLVLLAALPCGASNTPRDATRQVVQAGSEFSYPPFCTVAENGQADGFAVELLREALRVMHREVAFEIGTWADVKHNLAQGKIEVLPLVGRAPEREQLFDFTFPYLTMHGTILVRNGETAIQYPDDLRGKRVAVMAGDNAEEYLRRIDRGAVIVPTPTFAQAVRGLSEGAYDAVVIQKLLALHLMQKLGIDNLKTTGPPLADFVQSFCFAVRKGDHKLLSVLNEGLSIIIADGTYYHLRLKWFGPAEALEHNRKRIVVGGDNNYPPYEYLDDDGEPAGYNVELTRAIARQMGIAVEIRLGPWDAIRRGLETSRIDIVQGMFYSPGRDSVFNFSPSHTVINHVMVVRRGTSVPPSLSDLADRTIVVMRGDIMHDLAVEAGYAGQLTLVPSQEDALRLLAQGQGDVALVAKLPALYWIDRHGWKNLRVADRSLLSPEYCYASRHGKDRVLSLFAEGLANIKGTGEYRAIYAKWLGPYEPSPIGWRIVLKWSLFTTVPIGLLLVGAILWSRTLSRKVAEKTSELQKEIAERQQRELEIRAKNTELDEKNIELERFTYTASHDLKSPLVTLKSFLGFIEKDLRKGNTDRVMADMQHMHQAVDRMNLLLVNLLEMTRLGKASLRSEPLAFHTVVEETLLLLHGTIDESGATVEVVKPDLTLYADRVRLVQVWQNLIHNALKYRRDAVPVQIRIGVDTALYPPEFYVRDNGIGIDPRFHEKIFGLFDQLNPAIQGSGVGLALVKRIVELYGGRIWVESDGQDQGTCFRFTLPAALKESGA